MGSGSSRNFARNPHEGEFLIREADNLRTPRLEISVDSSPEVEFNLIEHWAPLSSSAAVTPTREMKMRTSIACTPHGEQAKQFPYYCPLW